MQPPKDTRLSLISPWIVTAIFTICYVLLILSENHWDPMQFVNIGGHFDPRQQNNAWGYDGQFVYQIALDPLHAPKYLDVPAYRFQRILYPALGRLLSFGSAQILPWVLILINIAALVGGTRVTERLLAASGANKWYALTYGLFLGMQVSIRLDLTEPLAFLFVQLASLSFGRHQLGRAGLFFILASLTRELTLLFAFAAVLTLFSRQQYKTAILWGLGTLLPFAVWQLILRLWLGEWGIQSGGAAATPFEMIPFHGWWGFAEITSWQIFLLFSLLILPIALIPASVSIIASLRALFHRQCNYGTWSLMVNAMLFPFLPASNVLVQLGMVRTVIGLMVAVLSFGAYNHSKRALNYSLLWVICLIFLYRDSFIGDVG